MHSPISSPAAVSNLANVSKTSRRFQRPTMSAKCSRSKNYLSRRPSRLSINLIAFATRFHYSLKLFKSLSNVTIAIAYRNAYTLAQRVQYKIAAWQNRNYSRKVWIQRSTITYDGKISWAWKAPPGRYMDWLQKLGSLWYITYESSFPRFPYLDENLRFAEIGGTMNFQTRIVMRDGL
jgi:hypothetical protein